MTDMGAAMSKDDVSELMRFYDVDGSGSIDFGEFVQIYKEIQNGRIIKSSEEDGQGNALIATIMKTDLLLKVQEELKDISNCPIDGIMMNKGVRGFPPTFTIQLTNPEQQQKEEEKEKGDDSLSSHNYLIDHYITITIKVPSGYPFRPPALIVNERVFHPNVICSINGQGAFPHIETMWESHWRLKDLLEHVVSIIFKPDLTFLPQPIIFSIHGILTKEEEEENVKEMDESTVKFLHEIDNNGVSQRNGVCREWYDTLTRIQQMHLNVAVLFSQNPSQFWKTAISYENEFAIEKRDEQEEEEIDLK